ncbi:MAG: hypothetical protein QM755_05980 [Luteolibacter sp.]
MPLLLNIWHFARWPILIFIPTELNCKEKVNSPTHPMTETRLEGLDVPPLPPVLETELAALGADGADRLLNVIRGLFHCIGDLNQRVAELEKRMLP